MCEVCSIFGAGEHWSDFGRLRNTKFPFEDIMHYREERKRRIDIINNLLAPHALTCEDWDGEAMAIYTRSGKFRLAPTLNDTWAVADDLAGERIIDPLSDDFSSPLVRCEAHLAG